MRPYLLNVLRGAALALMLVSLCVQAQEAQRFPTKPIRFIVPASAGGPSDVIARLVAERLSQALGQPVLVDNRPGASLMLGTSAVAKADPDGSPCCSPPVRRS